MVIDSGPNSSVGAVSELYVSQKVVFEDSRILLIFVRLYINENILFAC